MPVTIYSCAVTGFDCQLVEVEVEILPYTMPSFSIVGLGDTSIQESKHRIRSAIRNSGSRYPRHKKIVNLAPADLHKAGPLYDLPITLGLLAVSGQIPREALSRAIVVGELALDGRLRHVNGVLAITAFAKEHNFSSIILPIINAREAASIPGITIIAASCLKEIIDHLNGDCDIKPFEGVPFAPDDITYFTSDIGDIRGQEHAKRALEIAASGHHNVLMNGPPGSGKTLLARAFQSLLPRLAFDEALEVTKIYSIAGCLSRDKPFITTRPFRVVHHTASAISIVGGGRLPKPGEISLAHHGVLFFDEVPEFPVSVLEVLRQPMEDGVISITRAGGHATYPSKFIFIGAMNPCPCGFLTDSEKRCQCGSVQLARYHKKISGPLLDRIDLHVEVPRIDFKKLTHDAAVETSAAVRDRIEAARQIQQKRFKGKAFLVNSEMTPRDIKEFCVLHDKEMDILQRAASHFRLSGRGVHRVLKVARTIADLASSDIIQTPHIAEALQYRQTNVRQFV